MASAFGHAALAGAIGVALPNIIRKRSVILLGVFCSIFPDADVIGFHFGIRYGDLWGHRGMTHSIFFGVVFGIILSFLCYRSFSLKERWQIAVYFMMCTVSHGVLDAMTTGGKGIAFFSPFENGRYFLPWRMIQVSPLSISRFFDKWGLQVIQSELIWIGIPSLMFVGIVFLLRKLWMSL